jgi:hypothetical protein
MDPEKLAELEQAEEEIRSFILKQVGVLHCYMPSPKSHMGWFKRMLIKMQPGSVDIDWFPWGVPPVQTILESIQKIEGGGKELSDEEDAASDYLRELLVPFMEMQQQAAPAAE